MRTSLVLREDQPDKHGWCHIELVVHHRGKRLRWPTGQRVHPGFWSEKRRRVNATDKRHAEVNRRLVEIEARGKEIEVTHAEASLEKIRTLLSAGKVNTEGTFTEVARRLVNADKDLAWHSKQTWIGTLNKLDEFAPGIGVGEIDQATMRKYIGWAVRSGNHRNTAVKNVKSIRAMYNRVCEAAGITPKPIAHKLDLNEEQGPPKFVPLDRIKDVLDYRTDREIRQLAHDLWCFSFLCAGIRFRDLVDLRWKQFDQGWLNITEQHKTGHFKRSELTPRAQRILDQYNGGTYVFKVCGDRKVQEQQVASKLSQINPELHAISAELGIRPKMTTHTARHTWTEWALVNKVPYPLMMQMLGIKSLKSFLHYISRFNSAAVSDVYAEMRKQFGR